MSVEIELTTESTIASFGCAALRIHVNGSYDDYLPGDSIIQADGRRVLARNVVIRWLAGPGRSPEEFKLAKRFLG